MTCVMRPLHTLNLVSDIRYGIRLILRAPTFAFAVAATLVSVLLIIVATVAILIPARRATRIDPTVALRAD